MVSKVLDRPKQKTNSLTSTLGGHCRDCTWLRRNLGRQLFEAMSFHGTVLSFFHQGVIKRPLVSHAPGGSVENRVLGMGAEEGGWGRSRGGGGGPLEGRSRVIMYHYCPTQSGCSGP